MVTQVLRSPKENRTNKYSTYHDEEHAETKHTRGYPYDCNTMSIPARTEEINNRSCLECCQNDDPLVIYETAESNEYTETIRTYVQAGEKNRNIKRF